MAEVTVEQLAKVVGAPVERLLQQMQDAGLKQTKASEAVSDAEKKQLLAHLKSIHGDHTGTAEPTKITLKRKTVSQMKVSGGGGAGKKKVVNVEVRKKRTYVKNEKAEEQKPEEKRARGDSRRDGDRPQRRDGDRSQQRRDGDRPPRRE
ncbi:translation initiation factor IF-2 associated domain-containing protein, partial [Endozoicomonas sp. SESOKO4]